MASLTDVAEILAVFAIIFVMSYIAYNYIYNHEIARDSGARTTSKDLGRLYKSYLIRGGISVSFSLVNSTLGTEIKVKDEVGNRLSDLPVEDIVDKMVVKIGDGNATLLYDGKAYNYTCTTSNLGSNIKALTCGLEPQRRDNVLVSSVINGVVSNGKFTGSVMFKFSQ